MSFKNFENKQRSNRPKRRKGPLRLITSFNPMTGKEVLECGHEQYPVKDLVGETHAERRCCRQCRSAKP
jgi:hypothetical protein